MSQFLKVFLSFAAAEGLQMDGEQSFESKQEGDDSSKACRKHRQGNKKPSAEQMQEDPHADAPQILDVIDMLHENGHLDSQAKQRCEDSGTVLKSIIQGEEITPDNFPGVVRFLAQNNPQGSIDEGVLTAENIVPMVKALMKDGAPVNPRLAQQIDALMTEEVFHELFPKIRESLDCWSSIQEVLTDVNDIDRHIPYIPEKSQDHHNRLNEAVKATKNQVLTTLDYRLYSLRMVRNQQIYGLNTHRIFFGLITTLVQDAWQKHKEHKDWYADGEFVPRAKNLHIICVEEAGLAIGKLIHSIDCGNQRTQAIGNEIKAYITMCLKWKTTEKIKGKNDFVPILADEGQLLQVFADLKRDEYIAESAYIVDRLQKHKMRLQ